MILDDIATALGASAPWDAGLDGSAREALVATVEGLPDDVRERVAGWSKDPATAGRARAWLWSLTIAHRGGARAKGLLGDHGVRVAHEDGRELGLVPLDWTLPAHSSGAPADLDRLVRALENAFGDWRFLLHLRRPLPAGFEPAAVAKAVHLWRMALDRGDWRGRHAVYEDDAVSLDLSVVRRHTDAPTGRELLLVPPMLAADRLADVYQRLLTVLLAFDEQGVDVPIVAALAAQPAWRLPRGHVQEVLFGLADQIQTTDHTYEATFRPNALSMFNDPACRALAALWWLDVGTEGPLSWSGRAHENPWCDHGDALPAFGGPHFAEVASKETRTIGHRRPVTMAWKPGTPS